MKKTLLILSVMLTFNCLSQTDVITNNKLIINHGDITLYLSNDTSVLVSKHIISYQKFLKLDSDRDNKWFKDTYKDKYNKETYVHTGYDLGHLTPSHITSYNDSLNHNSFSLLNQAPQLASFNRGNWAQLESHVEDSIAKYKSDAVIITGVIYNELRKEYLGKSRIKIPVSYFKVLVIKNKTYCWVGSNTDGVVLVVTLPKLNEMFRVNNMILSIK